MKLFDRFAGLRSADARRSGAVENRPLYRRRAIVRSYASDTGLTPGEEKAVTTYRSAIEGKAVLDLGVGGGRTTPILSALAETYVAIDASAPMVEACRRRFPGVSIKQMDARDLSTFPDGSFDVVIFTFNGIDAVDHSGRLKILNEVRRVLAAGGLFIFSTHNRRYKVKKPWDLDHFEFNMFDNPTRFFRRLISYPIGIANYLRLVVQDEGNEDYEISVDSAHRYSVRHYRMYLPAQVRQIEEAGFRMLQAITDSGRVLAEADFSEEGEVSINFICAVRD